MITQLELLKVVDGEWVAKRAKALQTLPLCALRQHMKYGVAEYTKALHLRFGCITTICGHSAGRMGVSCPWVKKHGAAYLFLHKGGASE